MSEPAVTEPVVSADLIAWRALCRELGAVGERICAPDFPAGPTDRAEGFRHLLRMLTFATQWSVEFGDPDFPAFVRTTDDAVMFGGPSADNRNLRARVDGTGTYRIAGRVGSALDVLFTATGGDMALGQTSVSHEVSASELTVEPDGSFELIVGGTERPGNWLPMAAETRRIQVRQIFSDWAAQEPGWFDIERLDRTQPYPAPLGPDRMAQMLGEISRWVGTSATYWNDYQREILDRVPPNTIEAPSAQEGGGLSIRYGFGHWLLSADEAMHITFTPPRARYWSLQPYSLGWFEVLDYRNRQTTINNAQALVDDDGRVRVVLSATDPGTPNWIDTAGHVEGQLIFRWIWADEAESVAPECVVVPVADLTVEVPIDRAAVVRRRRTSVARRHRR
ncbi:MAG: hypothetical protein JWL72_490 [Ilumatobacteraceae bacterium]|nr:hypothetical protein [Ilumatobacteraceae bacterium]